MNLTVLAYQLKRVIAILGISALIAAVLASGNSAMDPKIMIAGILMSLLPVIW